MASFLDNSECAMFPPETRVCGPGGLQCIPGNVSVSAVCECEEGWTNYGDFALSPSGPCDMYILAVQALWGILCGANFCNFLLGLWFLWTKHRSFEKLDGASVTVIFAALDALCYGISGALRASNPLKYIVGGELFISFVYSLGTAFFWLGALTYFSNIVTVAYKNLRVKSQEARDISSGTMESIRKILPGFKVFAVLLSLLPFVLAIVNVSFEGTNNVGKYDQVITGIHFMGVAIMELALGIFLIPRWLGSLIEDCETVLNLDHNLQPLSAASKISEIRNERLKATVNKFKFIRNELRRQAILNGIPSILLACWTYLTHKATYIIAFNITCSAGIGAVIIWSLANFASKQSSKDTQGDGTTQKSSGGKKTQVVDLVSSPRSNNDDDTRMERTVTDMRREVSLVSDD